ncbi:hypothetical protein GUJ93_ZPchr0003g18347 [Zizania palustris]|uniref:Uncharacterized protein n=1 Tax=Zizania palustris TaxID=103762 RepID=A0A8J5SW30_ZIZPA|nr:hypothetical protein GUJ93_ZPchr0003g18347 [Zizania palustris]
MRPAPGETSIGFCVACLRERLAGLEASAAAVVALGRKSTSAIRSLFSRPFVASTRTSRSGGRATCAGGARFGRYSTAALLQCLLSSSEQTIRLYFVRHQ